MTSESPHDDLAEKSLLGALMVSREAISEVRPLVSGRDFHRPAHEVVFGAILELDGRGDPVDLVTLTDHLQKSGMLGRVGGGPYLADLLRSCVTPANADYYAKIVLENSRARQVIESARQTIERAAAGDMAAASEIAARSAVRAAAAGVTPEASRERPILAPEALVGVLGEIVAAADPSTEADPAGVLGTLLTAVSGLVGPDPHLRVGNTHHPLLIWTLLMGTTGRGRKGEACATAELFVRQAAQDDYGTIRVGGLSTGEGLIERIADLDESDDARGTLDKRLVVIESEFGSVLARARREGNTLSTVLRQAWDGGRLAVLNRRQLVASTSHVAVSGHITPREFRARLSAADMAGGSYNRYLPLYVHRSKVLPLPEGIDDVLLGLHSSSLRAAISHAREVRRLRLGPDGARVWAGGMYQEMTGGDDDGPIAQFVQRAAPYTLRVAALYAALQGRELISANDLDSAAALVRYAVASAEYVLAPEPSPVEAERDSLRLQRLREAVDRIAPEGLDQRAIDRLFAGHLKAADRDALVATLTATGDYVLLPDPAWSGRGRKAMLLMKVAR